MIGCGYPIAPLRVKDTMLLEDFGDNGDGGVDRIRNHKDESLGAGQGDTSCEVADNASVYLDKGVSNPDGDVKALRTLNKSSLKSW